MPRSNQCTGVLTASTASTLCLELARIGRTAVYHGSWFFTDLLSSRSAVCRKPPCVYLSSGTCVASWHWQASSAYRIARITRTNDRPDSSGRFSYVCQHGFVLTSYHEYGAAIVRARVGARPDRRADLVIEKNDLGSPGNAGCCEADCRLFLPSTVGNALLRQIVIYPARH